MHFFEKQRVDAAGVLGVKLQKALIFLGIVSSSAFFFGAALPAIFSILLLAIGFIGSYRRRPCLLSLYFWINVIIAILGVVFVISLMVAGSQTRQYGASSNNYSNEKVAVNPTPNPTDPDSPIPHTPYPPVNPTPGSSSESQESSQSSQSSQDSESGSYSYGSSSFEWDSSASFGQAYSLNAVIIIVLILGVILSVFVSFFKVYSIVLAWKMRRLLLASPTLPVCSKSSHNNTDCSAPSNATYPGYSAVPANPSVELDTSVAVPEIPQNIQGQVPMMYMPYPYMNNNNGGMMLNQYGQPIFYTYQPTNGFAQPQNPQ